MPLQIQPVSLNFAQGLDTKTDPKQVQIGKFLAMNNSVFTKAGLLAKRNGFELLTSLSNTNQTTLCTLNNNLLATGSSLYAFSEDTNQWLNQGTVQPVSLKTLPLLRVSTSQTSPDAVVAPNGLACLVYIDNGSSYYQISDSATGQQIVGRTLLTSSGSIPRVFVLGTFFIITFTSTISSAPHLRYIAVPYTMPSSPLAERDLCTGILSNTGGYDCIAGPTGLYFGIAGSGSTIKIGLLSLPAIASGTVPTPISISSHTATVLSMNIDLTGLAGAPLIWASFWDSSSTNGFSTAYSSSLAQVLAPTKVISSVTSVPTITAIAQNSGLQVYYGTSNTYGSIIGSVPTDFISTVYCSVGGTVGSTTVVVRSVEIASKAFVAGSTTYMLAAYAGTSASSTPSQPTYFLINSSGQVIMRLAYSNGGGYPSTQVLPNVSLLNDKYYTPYLANDFLASVNKGVNLPAGTPSAAIYTQTGVNLASFGINTSGQYRSEIASSLTLTGGMLWEYDGVRPVELGFQVWPDNVASSTTGSGGSVATGTYYYQWCYEWTDNAGNLHRSAPSIPTLQTVSSSDNSTNTVAVPTLRLTYKTGNNPVRIVGYRWSAAHPVFYQITSLTSPILNDTTIDYITFTDTYSDASILGNNILYTTGGVIENIAAPAAVHSCLYKNRLFIIDAEDQNLMWYSKQVIENVPVEMSDLLTLYIAPTTGSQGSTGPLSALSAMDDKLIMFKKDAVYYLTGTGPDNTGAQNDFSDPVYITSSVGCANPSSIVLMPNGIMFQSDKGIWLLGRDLSTSYIGAPVEAYNSNTVVSAQTIPGTNQVRFVLDNNVTLVYDYFYNQWSTFSNISAISSTLYNGLDTYLNSYGQVLQETPGIYLDNSRPVLMSFTTSWISLAGIQGFERFKAANLLGTAYTPFKLNAQIAYDYNPSPQQATLITPVDNIGPVYGNGGVYGSGGNYSGTSGSVFTARLFPENQKCQTFQLQVNEIYDPSYNIAAGQGLDLSGLLLLVGVKRGSRTQSAAKSFG